jgi:exodeoxyribonuclease VII small subunit
MSESSDNVDFEAALAELEALVEQMEAGDLTLEQSLQAFERGIALTRDCQKALKAAELRVQALTLSETDSSATLTELDSRDIDAADDD